VVAAVFLVVLIVLVVLAQRASSPSSSPSTSGQPVANIQCDTGEQTAVHYHAHVDILVRNVSVPIPAGVGIVQPNSQQTPVGPYVSSGKCFYWLHTHDTSGIVHVEAPRQAAGRQFTLGEFFKIWGQPLSTRQVATNSVRPGEQLKVWVDQKPYPGDPNNIVLHSHTQIVLEIGPPFTDPPPAYAWDQQLYPT
jgi:hypothetical protein